MKYRIKPTKDGWKIQYHILFFWISIPESGPFGTNYGWHILESAKSKLSNMIWNEAFEIKNKLNKNKIISEFMKNETFYIKKI